VIRLSTCTSGLLGCEMAKWKAFGQLAVEELEYKASAVLHKIDGSTAKTKQLNCSDDDIIGLILAILKPHKINNE
jgi:hypothetical protein